jgi:hypothetical protein
MRHLNLDELNDVQGGRLAARWGARMGEAFVNMYRAYSENALNRPVELESTTYGTADAAGYNPMGDYSDFMCFR